VPFYNNHFTTSVQDIIIIILVDFDNPELQTTIGKSQTRRVTFLSSKISIYLVELIVLAQTTAIV